ncbi:MAG TPA: OmpA family protein [Kofleriaceae bacterium]
MQRILLCVAIGALAAVRAPAVVRAEPGGNVDLNGFTPAMDSRGYLTVNASQVLGDKEFSFGLGSLDWGRHLLSLDGGGSTYSVDNIISATLIAAIGLHAGPAELELGASMPFTIMNGDRGPNLVDPQNSNNDRDYRFDGQGTGSLGLHFKTRFLKTSRPPHLGIGLMVSAYIQTTSPKDHFLGEDTIVPEAMLILDKELADGRLRMAVNGGIRYRKTTTFTNTDADAPSNGLAMTVGSEVPYKFGIAYAISKQRFDVVGEVFGSIPLGTHDNYQPLEALAGVKLYLARNSFLSLGAGRGLLDGKGGNPDTRAMIGIVFEPNLGDRDGDGIKDDVDKCPDDPEDFDGFEDEDGCPDPDNDRDGVLDVDDKCPLVPGPAENQGCPISKVGDRDGDGIPDNIDKCPDDPEDKDGFEDEDGCPDPDNDHDHILDKDDKCPNEPETYNGFQDDDGCPDHGPITEVNGQFIPMEPIQFEYNKAVIKSSSFYILDGIVAAMKGNPDIHLLEIAGHTDERGDDAYNLDLSIRRAAAVKAYLVAHGVEEDRLTSEGYGETQPVDRHHNEKAWATNRRVDFLILKRDAAP